MPDLLCASQAEVMRIHRPQQVAGLVCVSATPQTGYRPDSCPSGLTTIAGHLLCGREYKRLAESSQVFIAQTRRAL